MHPADELQEVRTEIRALRAREAALRTRLIEAPEVARAGRHWEAAVAERVSRKIDAARLPLTVRADPRSWLTRRSVCVTLQPRMRAAERIAAE
jgi:hypothetical protein